jgi:hypothetical protein
VPQNSRQGRRLSLSLSGGGYRLDAPAFDLDAPNWCFARQLRPLGPEQWDLTLCDDSAFSFRCDARPKGG